MIIQDEQRRGKKRMKKNEWSLRRQGTIKHTNTFTDGILAGEERENIFKEIMTEHFANLPKNNNPYIQGAK